MQKISFLFSLLLICLVSCNNEDVLFKTNSDIGNLSEEGIKLYAQKEIDISTKGVGLTHKFWDPGQTIRIKFLNGTETQKSKVMEFSKEWTEYANLNFEFVDTSESADVKIAFDWEGDRVTWSTIGTDARDIPQHLPSLNFGNLSTFDAFIKRDVLMQFGHVLGLVNEHQGVNNTLELNTELIYDYYIAEGWTILEVQNFFFNPYASEITNYTEYDIQSIMVWPIDAIFTTNGVGQQRNSILSEMDKEFIAQVYPYADDDTRYTILRFSSTEEFTIDWKASLNNSGYISIDFGNGTQFEGLDTMLPEITYPAGEYNIKIEAKSLSIVFGSTHDGIFPGSEALKYLKLNGITEYQYLYFWSTPLEEIETDSQNPPLITSTWLDQNFGNTKIKTIPENLFYKCYNITHMYNVFSHCTELEYIPEKLFVNMTQLINLYFTFFNCSSLTYIPENLFQNCTELFHLEFTFNACSNLIEIPEKLFYNNNKITSLIGTFYGCTSLIELPENLFMNCTEIESIYMIFGHCSNLIEIPERMFFNNTKITDAGSCFTDCTSLRQIPENLFENCFNIKSFIRSFLNCKNLKGEAPRLWERTDVNGQSCFNQCTQLTNYMDIPLNWKASI